MFHSDPDILKDCDLLFFIDRFQYTQEPGSNAIVIDNIEVKPKFRKQGVCRGILKYLRSQGINVSVKVSTIEALPFWRKMFEDGWIQSLPRNSYDRRL